MNQTGDSKLSEICQTLKDNTFDLHLYVESRYVEYKLRLEQELLGSDKHVWSLSKGVL